MIVDVCFFYYSNDKHFVRMINMVINMNNSCIKWPASIVTDGQCKDPSWLLLLPSLLSLIILSIFPLSLSLLFPSRSSYTCSPPSLPFLSSLPPFSHLSHLSLISPTSLSLSFTCQTSLVYLRQQLLSCVS